MNKYPLIFTILFLTFSHTHAQLNTVTTLDHPRGIAIKENFAYVLRSEGFIISKIDLTTEPAIVTDFINTSNFMRSLAFYGNDLYFAEQYGTRIFKVDVTSSSPTIIEVVNGLNNPNS